MSAVHLDRDGRARCGTPGARLVGAAPEVTCNRCLDMMAGVYTVGHTWPDLRPCGTTAAYRRHQRHGEKPCAACKQAVARRRQDQRRAA